MICPMCLGKGYATDEDIKEYPHGCPNCNGKGFYSVDWQNVRCEVCNGSGKKPQTNEEWLHTLNTEQLAEEIYGFVWCCNELWQRLCCSGDGTDKESDLKIVREWLKQPHQ